MHKTMEVVVFGQDNHGGRFWRTVVADGVRGGAILGTAGLILADLYLHDSHLPRIFNTGLDVLTIGAGLTLGRTAGVAARKILHH